MKTLPYLILAFALVGVGMFAMGKYVQSRPTSLEEVPDRSAPPIMGSRVVGPLRLSEKHKRFIETIQDVYDVESAKFVRDDYLQVIFSPVADEDEQGTCQAIANLWAHHQPQPLVTVDCWQGEKRIAHATVVNGRTIAPPPPTGRRSSAGLAKRKAEREAMAPQKKLEVLIALKGKTMAEIEGTHGPAKSRNPATGWAEWPKFKARFQDGKVFDVEVY